MVGAGAMLAGVSRLTISLVVVLFELTWFFHYRLSNRFPAAYLEKVWVCKNV
jgi:hypothetical protein